MKKLKCNECFQDLVVVEYDEAIYINPCECQKEKHIQDSWVEGYEEGYEEGRTDGHDQGWNDSLEEKELEINQAYNEGKAKGYEIGYTEGCDVGYEDGHNSILTQLGEDC